tara:strand:- start:7018 stop:7452 length:435 start_codon:yes stop_codon:yes gene_type:complete
MVKLNIVKSFFKNRKRVILDRHNTSEYLVRYYLFIKDRKSFPFNITLHKILMSDEPTLHNHPWNWGALIVKGGYWEHTPDGKFWRGPGSFRFRKSGDLHYLELAKDKDGNELPCWSLFFMGRQTTDWGFKVNNKIVNHAKYLKE